MGIKMNLIEQLGYEEAKKQFDELKNHKEFYAGEFAKNDAMLLEYRQRRDIYEVNDKVIFVDSFMHGEIMTVTGFDGDTIILDNGDELVHIKAMIDHASPEEIAAGHRID